MRCACLLSVWNKIVSPKSLFCWMLVGLPKTAAFNRKAHDCDLTQVSRRLESARTWLFIRQLIRERKMINQSFPLLIICEGNPPVIGGFSAQRVHWYGRLLNVMMSSLAAWRLVTISHQSFSGVGTRLVVGIVLLLWYLIGAVGLHVWCRGDWKLPN